MFVFNNYDRLIILNIVSNQTKTNSRHNKLCNVQ